QVTTTVVSEILAPRGSSRFEILENPRSQKMLEITQHVLQALFFDCFTWTMLSFTSFTPSVTWMCQKHAAETLSSPKTFDHFRSLVTYPWSHPASLTYAILRQAWQMVYAQVP